MAIALNASPNPNGQTPSVGPYGDLGLEGNSLLGNFGDLLTLISADAEKALYEQNPVPLMTEKQTSEALIAFAEGGNEEAKLVIASILQRVVSEESNQLHPKVKGDIQTTSFLEAKIESKLEQQNLLKPAKILEFLSLEDLKLFGKGFEHVNAEDLLENSLDQSIEIIATPFARSTNDLENEDFLSITPATAAKSNLIGAAAATNTSISTNDIESITTQFITNVGAVSSQPNETDIAELNPNNAHIVSQGSVENYPLSEKDQILLDVVKDILQVNSANLDISGKGPSEVIFDVPISGSFND